MSREPRATRPYMPGYGVHASTDDLLPWSWAEERLAAAHNSWLATVNPDGSPHAMAVWTVWFEGEAWFSTGLDSRKARNLRRDSRCTLTTERADEAVIIEGVARFVPEADGPAAVIAAYAARYGGAAPAGRPVRGYSQGGLRVHGTRRAVQQDGDALDVPYFVTLSR